MSIELNELPARQEPRMFEAAKPKAEAAREPAAEVGFFLQREREQRGLSIADAADATGIHPYHIDAIELGDLTHMPPRLEAIEMIAGYAQWLGFEPEPLVEHLAKFFPPPPIVPQRQHPANPSILSSAKVLAFGKLPKVPNFSVNLNSLPGGSRGVVSALAAAFVLLVGAHWSLSHQPSVPGAMEQVAVAEPSAAPPVAEPAAPKLAAAQKAPEANKVASAATDDGAGDLGNFITDKVAQPAAAPALKAAKQGKAAKVAQATTKMQDRIKVEDQIKTASTSAIPTPSDGRVYGAENKDAHLVLKAVAPVWLRIEDAQGIAVMTQMLNTGDTYRVPNRPGLVALSRDGSRLAFVIDGVEKGVLGAPGKILTGESLDITALQTKK